MTKILLGALILFLSTPSVFAQVNPRGETTAELTGGKVTVEYGRPSLKGRDIKTMISAGEQWRMGADASTTLATDVDLKFGDQSVPKGEYILRAKVLGEQKWLLLIHGKDYSKVAEVPMKLEERSENVERLTIRVEGQEQAATFSLEWGKLSLSASFTTS